VDIDNDDDQMRGGYGGDSPGAVIKQISDPEESLALKPNSPSNKSSKAGMEITVDPNVRKEDEEKVPDLGGTKRLNREYARRKKCRIWAVPSG